MRPLPKLLLTELRTQVARLEKAQPPAGQAAVLPFGVTPLDSWLPEGGLRLGGLHEMSDAGPGVEHGSAATLMAAGIMARTVGQVLWVISERDLFMPGLQGAGLQSDRVLLAEAGKDTLLVMEEGLRSPGLAGVVAEIRGRLSLTASRRLQLAAERSGLLAIALRRSRKHDDPAMGEPSAALTRWRIHALPSPPVLAHAPDTPGLGPPLWRLDLTRCRGGEAASWIVEACDAQGYLHLATDLADRSPAAQPARQLAAG